MKRKLYVIGIGPGGREHMTLMALKAIEDSDAVIGYGPYISYIEDLISGKEVISTGMGGEMERVEAALKSADSGKTTCIVSTGDAGLYGMAGPVCEMGKNYPEVEIVVVPGVSSAFMAGAVLGAPLMHDTALISLSDLLTDWDLIKERVRAASEADFVIALYNPKSKTRLTHLEEAVEIMKRYKSPETRVGIVKNAGREGEEIITATLDSIPYDRVDMMTTLIIGNKTTFLENGKMVTPRGYSL